MEIVKDNVGVYRCGDVVVVPYPTENFLAAGFLRLERENLLDVIFHEGVPTLSWFLQVFSGQNQILSCFSGIDEYSHIGFAWLNKSVAIGTTGKKKLEVGHGYFRKTSPRHVLTASAVSVEWIFDKHPDLEAIYGTTPEMNRAAVRFLKRLGLEQFGPIPGYTCYPDESGSHVICGAVLSAMTRRRWETQRRLLFDGLG